MEFRVLGPLEVRRGGKTVAVPGGKPRSVLAFLLLHANEPVSADRLAVALWGEDAPTGAARTAQVYVSRLRRVLDEDERLITSRAGYRLRVRVGELDLDRFERLVDDGRRALAAGRANESGGLLREALQLWQGPALADVAFEPFAQSEIRRLEEMRLAALEARVEADLEVGRHAELVPELQRVVGEYPLRERLHGQLMLALYRAGRQADALSAFRRARQILIERVGIEPGRELRDLEHAILTQDPELMLDQCDEESEPQAPGARRGPRSKSSVVAGSRGEAATEDVARDGQIPLPPPLGCPASFVGRAAELAGLRDAWRNVVEGERTMVLVAGEAGIGKTSLAACFAAEVHADAGVVLYGRCDEFPSAPYQPFVEAIGETAAHDPEFLEDADSSSRTTRRETLTSAIAPRGADEPRRRESANGARYRFFAGVTSALDVIAGTRALLLVLDDLHWADRPTLLLLRHVVRHSAGRTLILGTYRNSEVPRSHPLGDLLVDLRRERALEHLVLAGLEQRDVETLVSARAVAYGQPRLVRWVQAQTAGHPFFVAEVLRELPEFLGEAGDAAPVERVLERFPVPEGVRQLISWRLARLTPGTEEVLALASAIGSDFELTLLEGLAGQRDQVVAALDESVRTGLTTETPGHAGRYSFAHALVRETIYQGLTATRRALTHLHIGELLERRHATEPDAAVAEIAHHFAEARALAPPTKVRDYLVSAARKAAAALAFETAADYLRRALELAPPPDARSEFELLLALADSQQRAGERAPAQEALRRAAKLARRLGDADALGRAALGYGGGFPWYGFSYRTDPELTALLEEAITAQGDHGDAGVRVRLLARLALERYYDTRYADASTLSAEAVKRAERLQEPEARLVAQYSALFPLDGPDDVVRLEEAADQIVALAGAEGDDELGFRARVFRLRARLQLANAIGVDADIDACTHAAQRLRQPIYRWQASVLRAMRALMRGSLAGGERESQAAFATGVEAGQAEEARYVLMPQLLIAAWLRGRLLDFEASLRAYLESAPTMEPRIEATLSWVLAEGGRRDEAQKWLARCMERDPAHLPRHSLWLLMIAQLAETSALLAQPAHAERLYPLLRPYEDRCLITGAGAAYGGAVSYFLGRLAGVLRRWDESEHWFQTAVRTEDLMDARPHVARAQLAWATMLRQRSAPGDRARSPQLASAALSTATELGLTGLRERASSIAEDLRTGGHV